jgi:hypothetical protein
MEQLMNLQNHKCSMLATTHPHTHTHTQEEKVKGMEKIQYCGLA